MVGNKVAVVTAAGSGMGAAAAERLARDGFRIAILSSSGKGEALARSLGGIGVTGSKRSNDDLGRLVERTVATGANRRPGQQRRTRAARVAARAQRRRLASGHGDVSLERRASDETRHAHHGAAAVGAIVNISTFAAFEPDPLFPTSGVFRAGLAAYTKLLADRYAASNIRMNNVLPGFIDSLPEKPELRDRIPMGRYGRTAEIAEVIAFTRLRRRGLHHGTESQGRRWHHPFGLKRGVGGMVRALEAKGPPVIPSQTWTDPCSVTCVTALIGRPS